MLNDKKITLRQYRYAEELKVQKRQWLKEYRAEKKAEYENSSTLEQRRSFIELMRDGNISVACAAEKVGITTEHAIHVYFRNHRKVFYLTLVDPEKVK